LEQSGVLDHETFDAMNVIRRIRNKIVHEEETELTDENGALAIETAVAMIQRRWGVAVRPNLSYSIMGL
jgi:hypothetical protein